MISPVDRCLRYVATMEPSIAGSKGHDAAFKAACVIVQDFGLSGGDAWQAWCDFNSRCMPPWSEREGRHKMAQAEKAKPREGKARGWMLANSKDYKPAPGDFQRMQRAPVQERDRSIPAYDPLKLERFASKSPVIDREWLRVRSPLPVMHGVRAGIARDFLDALYEPGEKVLVFRSSYSQGDWLHTAGGGTVLLSKDIGVDPVASDLPTSGPEGIWFLAQPVTGEWAKGDETMTRRSQVNVAAWRYMLLESDDAPPQTWVRALAQLPLPIVALYTSGGRSIHALLRVGANSKPQWDLVRDALRKPMAELGGDPGAMTAVRLTRLPGCWREGKRGKDGKFQRFGKRKPQELLWLNPEASNKPLLLSPVRRG